MRALATAALPVQCKFWGLSRSHFTTIRTACSTEAPAAPGQQKSGLLPLKETIASCASMNPLTYSSHPKPAIVCSTDICSRSNERTAELHMSNKSVADLTEAQAGNDNKRTAN